MKRLQTEYLFKWFSKKRRKPLIIRGARQIGKSTLVRMFAKQNGIELLELNLERHLDLNDLFATFNINKILISLEDILHKKITGQNQLLFLDEIQATPSAIAALRYFFEDHPEIAVIAAGSLLEFTLADHSFSMPVGRIEYLHMNPMFFSEYLQAMDDYLYSRFIELCQSANLLNEMNVQLHEQLLVRFKEYLIVGGMPEAVDIYRKNLDYNDVEEVQRSICETYEDDFAKYASRRELVRLQKLYKTLPGAIGQKVILSKLLPGEAHHAIKRDLELLKKARIFTPIIHTAANGIPLGAEVKEKTFKISFLDVGLVSWLSGLRASHIHNIDDASLVNKGPLCEQFVSQNIMAEHQSNVLYYWQREGKSENAEIDILIQDGPEIIPVEVKSGTSGAMKSLHQFCYEKGSHRAIRFDLNLPSQQKVRVKIHTGETVSYDLKSYPVYFAGAIK